MQIITDSCTFGKVPKTTQNPFFDILKTTKRGIEKQTKSTIKEAIKKADNLTTTSRLNKD